MKNSLRKVGEALWIGFCIIAAAVNFSNSEEWHLKGDNLWALFYLGLSVLFTTWAVLSVIDLAIYPRNHKGDEE